jgi:NTE family protein
MKSQETSTRALVLGGGGVAGVAWELGILLGLHEKGVEVRNADLLVGTSAGSVVGAQVAGETDLESLFAAQLVPAEQSRERMATFDPAQMAEVFRRIVTGADKDVRVRRARIGAYALSDNLGGATACHHRGSTPHPELAAEASADRCRRY